MKKMLQAVLVAMLLLPSAVKAQDTFTEITPPVGLEFDERVYWGAVSHGTVVDDNDRVWIAPWGDVPEGVEPGIVVLNADGSHAPFSPISSVTIDGSAIDLTGNTGGITLDHVGNILLTYTGGRLIRINKDSGEGMGMWTHPAGSALTKASVDGDGYAYVSIVAGAPVIFVLDIEGGFTETLQIEDPEFPSMWTRTQSVVDDGTMLVTGLLGGVGLLVWESEDLSTYTPRLLGENAAGERLIAGDASSTNFAPDGTLWVTDEGRSDPEFPEKNVPQSLRVFDFDDYTYYVLRHDSLDAGPRGVGFYEDGDDFYVYVVSFVTGHTTRFRVSEDAVSADDNPRVTTFALEQNYPNPFTANTSISYTLDETSTVSLKVYDITGRLVSTIVDGQPQMAGTHSVDWNAVAADGHALPSGTYLYRLEAGGQSTTKAMVLLR